MSWFDQLSQQGLPGDDFTLQAPSSTYDQWLSRPASYGDLRRSLHFLLHVCLAMPAEEAVKYNPHCFRHFLITSGQQLRALDICTVDDIERLGRWSKGSRMPDVYDSALGVSDLMARHKVVATLRTGWTPAVEGQLPCVPPPSTNFRVAAPVRVANKVTHLIHIVYPPSSLTSCTSWTCGTAERPAKNALFKSWPSNWKACFRCV